MTKSRNCVCGMWGAMVDAATIQDQRRGLLRPALSLVCRYPALRLRMGSMPTLRKWVKEARESGSLAISPRSAFIPVVAADGSLPVGTCSLDMSVTCDEEQRASLEKTVHPSGLSKISALLPNGVKLSLECRDVDALTAVIGALGHVQTGR